MNYKAVGNRHQRALLNSNSLNKRSSTIKRKRASATKVTPKTLTKLQSNGRSTSGQVRRNMINEY